MIVHSIEWVPRREILKKKARAEMSLGAADTSVRATGVRVYLTPNMAFGL